MGIPGEYYERGLLHPFVRYEDATRGSTRSLIPSIASGTYASRRSPALGRM